MVRTVESCPLFSSEGVKQQLMYLRQVAGKCTKHFDLVAGVAAGPAQDVKYRYGMLREESRDACSHLALPQAQEFKAKFEEAQEINGKLITAPAVAKCSLLTHQAPGASGLRG
eukprot:scaffold126162_cov17-Tisochrysis_lutea.AAC.1